MFNTPHLLSFNSTFPFIDSHSLIFSQLYQKAFVCGGKKEGWVEGREGKEAVLIAVKKFNRMATLGSPADQSTLPVFYLIVNNQKFHWKFRFFDYIELQNFRNLDIKKQLFSLLRIRIFEFSKFWNNFLFLLSKFLISVFLSFLPSSLVFLRFWEFFNFLKIFSLNAFNLSHLGFKKIMVNFFLFESLI